MSPPLGRCIKRWCYLMSDCLTSVCLSVAYIGPKSRTFDRPRKTKNWHRGSQRHMWLGHHFQGQKVKGQGHQTALLTAVLGCQAAAAVGVGTCWPWETAATLPSARRRKALRRPRGGEVPAYCGGRPPTACINLHSHSHFVIKCRCGQSESYLLWAFSMCQLEEMWDKTNFWHFWT